MSNENMCLHCLEEGNWVDEDKCPKCANMGHISPWRVGQCSACNNDYFNTIYGLINQVKGRSMNQQKFLDIPKSDDFVKVYDIDLDYDNSNLKNELDDSSAIFTLLDYAASYGLQAEVIMWFIRFLKEGNEPMAAIDYALGEWDL